MRRSPPARPTAAEPYAELGRAYDRVRVPSPRQRNGNASMLSYLRAFASAGTMKSAMCCLGLVSSFEERLASRTPRSRQRRVDHGTARHLAGDVEAAWSTSPNRNDRILRDAATGRANPQSPELRARPRSSTSPTQPRAAHPAPPDSRLVAAGERGDPCSAVVAVVDESSIWGGANGPRENPGCRRAHLVAAMRAVNIATGAGPRSRGRGRPPSATRRRAEAPRDDYRLRARDSTPPPDPRRGHCAERHARLNGPEQLERAEAERSGSARAVRLSQ